MPTAFVRAWLSTGLSPSFPPISSRSQKLPYNKELYRGRNRVERFFNKLKQFRRMATRYDKLAKTFCAALQVVVSRVDAYKRQIDFVPAKPR